MCEAAALTTVALMTAWPPPPFKEGEDEAAIKKAFAELWARFPFTSPAQLLMKLLPGQDNISRCYVYAELWVADWDVIAMRDNSRLDAPKVTSDVPSKDDLVKEILAIARTSGDVEEKLKGFKLVAEVLGYVTKPGIPVIPVDESKKSPIFLFELDERSINQTS